LVEKIRSVFRSVRAAPRERGAAVHGGNISKVAYLQARKNFIVFFYQYCAPNGAV